MNCGIRIHIGTSGWSYPCWSQAFYSKRLPQGRWLKFYAERFDTVEINNTFYRLPESKTFEKWSHQVPEHFLFSVKVSRYITHYKKLKGAKDSLSMFLSRIESLEEKLGPILFQLPSRWQCNFDRLKDLLPKLSCSYRYVFEFRDRTWLQPQIYELLNKNGVAFCIYGMDGQVSPMEVTADFIYLRLHGPTEAYRGQYEESVLDGWAKRMAGWSRQGKEIFFYFNNDERGYAPKDALRLKAMVETEK